MPLKIIREDITKIQADAIVNPTNEVLYPSGGTDAAIHAAAGKELLSACQKIGHLALTEAKETPAYDLPARYVIHVAGPAYVDGKRNEAALLRATYLSALKRAATLGCESIGFPLISSGIHGFPKHLVLKIAIDVIGDFLLTSEMTVYLAVFDKTAYTISQKLFFDVRAYIDDAYADEHYDSVAREIEEENYESYLSSREIAPPVDARRICVSAPEQRRRDKSLTDILKKQDQSFALTLLKLIDKRGLSDVAAYKKANVSKQTWYKILNDAGYKPSRNTVLSFAIALELSLEETQALLATVGYTLSKSIKFDLIISFFIKQGIYDIFEIEETLLQFDQPLLSSHS